MSGTKATKHTCKPADLPVLRFAWSNAGGQGDIGEDTERLVVKYSLGAVLDAIERVRCAGGAMPWEQVREHLEQKAP